MSINIASLPVVPSSDVRNTTDIVANTTDSNGQPYTGRMSVETFRDAAFGGGTFQASVTLTPAQIINGNTTPIACGITVPAGYAAQVIRAAGRLTWGSVAYDLGSTLHIGPNASGYEQSRWSGALASTANDFTNFQNIAGPGGTSYIDGSDLYIWADADSTVGDSPVTVYITYMLIEL
jgi:hypothetical protein